LIGAITSGERDAAVVQVTRGVAPERRRATAFAFVRLRHETRFRVIGF
jgi:hypothetical protein